MSYDARSSARPWAAVSMEGMYSVFASCVVQDRKGIRFEVVEVEEVSALSRDEVKFERSEFVSSLSERPGGRRIEPSPVIMFLEAERSRSAVAQCCDTRDAYGSSHGGAWDREYLLRGGEDQLHSLRRREE